MTGRGQRVGEFMLEVGVPTGLPRRHVDLPARRRRAVRSVDQLVERGELAKMWVLRRILMPMGPVDAMEFLIDKLRTSKSNDDFFLSMNQ